MPMLWSVVIVLCSVCSIAYCGDLIVQPTSQTQAAVRIEDLPTIYAKDKSGKVVLGNIDRKAERFYQWRGVAVGREADSKEQGEMGSGRTIIIELEQLGYAVELIDPPIRYLSVDKDTVVPGYQASSVVFYQFKDEKIDRKQLPNSAVIIQPKSPGTIKTVIIPRPDKSKGDGK